MSRTNPLAARERALEEAFFRKENERLLTAMREREARNEQFQGLSEVLGIHADEIIDSLIELGLREENVTALVLAPLVSVAWADQQLDDEERRSILKAGHDLGIEPDSEAAQLLSRWLDHRPHESLLSTWIAYVGELCQVLGAKERARLRDETIARSRRIANALEKSVLRAGGPSESELAVLAQIEAAFDDGTSEKSDKSLDDAICSTT